MIIPFQSGVRSEDVQVGHCVPMVIRLHFLHANSRVIYFPCPKNFARSAYEVFL